MLVLLLAIFACAACSRSQQRRVASAMETALSFIESGDCDDPHAGKTDDKAFYIGPGKR